MNDELTGRLKAVVIRLDGVLPQEQMSDIWSLVEANEAGVALENLCTQLYEYDVSVAPEILHELQVIGSSMQLEPSLWEDLRLIE